jgi:Flp pilus assembly protein TadB
MQLTPVLCSQCGAPLEVPADVNFVTCGHCHIALAVKRDAQVIYTEVLQQLDRKTDLLAQEIARLRYRSALEDIDRHWKHQRERMMFRDKSGREYEPRAEYVVLAAVVVGIVAVVSTNVGGLGAALAIAVVGGGVCMLMWSQVQSFRRAEKHFRRRRQALKIEDFLPRE